jgi:uncharacterized protein (TIGR02099 family)
LKHGGLWFYKVTTFAVLVAGFGFAAVVLGLRYYLLPEIDHYRSEIEAMASRALGAPVTIARIDADWDGLRPHLTFGDLRIADPQERTGLLLNEVHATLSWRSLLLLQPVFHALEIDRPTLVLRRTRDGGLWMAGLPLAGGQGDEGFGDSLLKHRQIIVLGATVIWVDEKLGAPELTLTEVDFRLDSRGRRHRFGLRAVPPAALALPLDVRGDLRGGRLSDLANWGGTLYLELAYTDFALWRQWLPWAALPTRGTGAVRAWVDVFDGAVAQATGDVRLADVLTRLDPQLPELALRQVNGRVGWKRLPDGFEVSSRALAFATPAGGSPQPLDLAVRRVLPGQRDPERLDLRANVLDLALLTAIGDRLPIGDEIRRDLVAVDAQGLLRDVNMSWSGPFDQPTAFRVAGRFDDLGVRPGPGWPGVEGLDGSVDANEKGGAITLKTREVLLDAPTVFSVPLAFDTVDAQVAWTLAKNRLEVKATSLAFANRDLAGNFGGTYQRDPGSPGVIDVNASLARLDPQVMGRYLPLVIEPDAREWLDRSLLGGRLTDARFKVKGDLAQFPWPGGKNGQFSVQAQLDDVALQFDEDWPRIDGIKGAVSFKGERLELFAQGATVMGIRIANVRGAIKDLYHDRQRLDIAAEASGTTTEFLNFIESSPVGEMIGHLNREVRAIGSGKLDVKLEVPLHASRDTRVAGSYLFTDNRLLLSGDVPPIDRVNAKLEFTETGIHLQNGTAVALGGPAVVNIGTAGGTVTIGVAGRADLDAFRGQGIDYYWLQYLRGTAAWRGTIVLKQGLTDYFFDSDLQGVGSTLPAPLAKTTSEVIPARFERRAQSPDADRLEVAYGKALAFALERRRSGDTLVPARGMLALNVPVTLPESGISIVGNTPAVNLSRWQSVFDQVPPGSPSLPLSAIDVTVGALQWVRRPFNDLRLTAGLRDGVWQGKLSGPELNGNFTYVLKDNGKLTAHLTQLTLPATDPADKQAATAPTEQRDSKEKPPNLDVIADAFRLGDKDLGRLEVVADVEGQNWRIDKLTVTNPDATLHMKGQWRSWLVQPSTDVSVDLEVADAGKLLKRLGYPEGIKGGKSKLLGNLEWRGRPQDLDLATLSGDLTLEAEKGRFVKLDPGIAKLLGVISLQSLPRRISLDFGDIFSAGLAFDGISATITIAKGIAGTTDFLIRSPSASIGMTGNVDLAAETQNLRVRVVPYLGEGVALGATALGGPIAGVAALALQKILRDPIGQIMAFEYAVTGTWSDPQVSKIGTVEGQPATPPG